MAEPQAQQARDLWASGDYPSAGRFLADAGRLAAETTKLTSGDLVLDIGCGDGNATIPAAKTGATVTGFDLTPELLEAGRAAAAEAGVRIDWVEGDAAELPFDGEAFDVAISVFGCMFAPDHRAAASEIARILKPGGRLVVCAWTPEGNQGQMFRTIAKHMPAPPEGFEPPTLWGDRGHLREIFEGTGVELDIERAQLDFVAESAEAYLEEMERDLPPIAAARELLEPQGKWEPLREDLLELCRGSDASEEANAWRMSNEYLLIKGQKAA
jgi:SAM-dependent methyltransferase